MGCFDLSGDTNGKLSEINSDLADYVNKHIKTFMSSQTLKEGILSANSILSNITGDFLQDLYLKELLSEEGQRFSLNQNKGFPLFMGHSTKLG